MRRRLNYKITNYSSTMFVFEGKVRCFVMFEFISHSKHNICIGCEFYRYTNDDHMQDASVSSLIFARHFLSHFPAASIISSDWVSITSSSVLIYISLVELIVLLLINWEYMSMFFDDVRRESIYSLDILRSWISRSLEVI